MKKNVLLGLISLILLVGVVSVASADTLNYYYADIEIYNNPGLNDYQTYTTINYRAGMNTDFSNIRMYDSAGTEIPYYIESYTNSTSAKVWYQIDSDTVSVQCRWGIANETESKSNPETVYDFYEGFSTLSSSVWENVTSAGSISVLDGVLTINGGSSATSGINGIKSRYQVAAVGTITELKIKRTASASNWAWKNAGISNSGLTSSYLCAENASAFTNNEVGSVKFVSRTTSTDQSTVIIDTTAWITESFVNTGTSAIYLRNGTVVATHNTYYPTVATCIQAGAGNNAKADAIQIDYVQVRKYAASEPITIVGTTKTSITRGYGVLDSLSGENPDLLGFMVSPYTSILGGYFWVLVGLVPVFMMYLKCQDLAIPLMSGLLFTAAFGFAFPENLGVALIMLLGTGIGAMLFKTFKGAGN